MLLSDCEIGQTVMFGKRDHLAQGIGGEEVTIKDVGPYTITPDTGCPGYKAVKVDRATRRVFIVRQIEHTDYSERPYTTRTIPADAVVTGQQLMTVDEYNAKAKARLAVEKAGAEHTDRGRGLAAELAELVAPHVAKLPFEADVHLTSRWADNAESLRLTVQVKDLAKCVDRLPVKVRPRFRRTLDAYNDWRATKNPAAC